MLRLCLAVPEWIGSEEMRVVAFSTEPKTIDRILAHQGIGGIVAPFRVQPVPADCKARESQIAENVPNRNLAMPGTVLHHCRP